jgi:hypothetical protein
MRIVQRWKEYQPTKEQALWVALAAVIATLVVGFGMSGWVTGGTARKMADEAASGAHNQLAAAVCAEHFMRSADAKARLAKLHQLQWWERDEHLVAGGWATMPGEKEANSAVAHLCAARLSDETQA